MTEKIIRGQKVMNPGEIRNVRNMLPEECKKMLLPQAGSVAAICIADECDGNLYHYCMALNKSGLNMRLNYNARREFIRKSNLRFLVSHRTDNDRFSLVGGARKLGEGFNETAFRELGEETGLTLKDLIFIDLISGGDEMINIYPDGNAAEGIDALYLAMVPKGTVIRPNSETREFIWMTPDEISACTIMNRWHPAQVKTARTLLSSLLQLPEIYEQQTTKPNW